MDKKPDLKLVASAEPETHQRPRERGEATDCPKCGQPRVLRQPKQKMLSYLLFVASFAAFLVVSSLAKLTPTVKGLWLTAQILLAGWTIIDRRNNTRHVLYCRSCDTRLSF